MLVYRVEDDSGRGMYSARGADYLYCREQAKRKNPGPLDDIPRWSELSTELRRRLYFGFKDEAQLYQWLAQTTLYRLAWGTRSTLKVVVYEVDEDMVIPGHHQVTFVKMYAKPVNQLSLRTLYRRYPKEYK